VGAQSQVESKAGGGKREEVSIKIAQGEVVLVEAEVVAKFVEVGGTDLLRKSFGVSLGQVPKVVKIKNDAGRGIGGEGIGLQTASALEQAKQIRFKSLIQDGLIGGRLVEGDHGLRGDAEFGGQAGPDLLDARRSQLV